MFTANPSVACFATPEIRGSLVEHLLSRMAPEYCINCVGGILGVAKFTRGEECASTGGKLWILRVNVARIRRS